MSELILTEKEKADPSYFNWSDKALANSVRHAADLLKDMDDGRSSIYMVTCAHLLIKVATDANSETTTLTMSDVTNSGIDNGDWEITVKRTRAPN